MSATATRFLWGAAAAGGLAYSLRNSSFAESQWHSFEESLWGVSVPQGPGVRNHAFVFIKPHANTERVRELVEREFAKLGINITGDGEITGEAIDANQYIDQHYYAIASKATILKPHELNVPADKFKEKFGLEWSDALEKGVVYNAMDACKKLGVDADQLDKLWAQAKKDGKLVKFGGGFYCGKLEVEGKDTIYAFNGFFMKMRSKFTAPGTSIHYYTVDFAPEKLSWEDFRGKVLGPTDPADAPEGSLRRSVFNDWEKLGLGAVPNVGDNAVHASASPFEGLAERTNWMKSPVSTDPFGKELLGRGVDLPTIKAWSVDPQVKGEEGKKQSIFDQLEDLDAVPCAQKAARVAAMA